MYNVKTGVRQVEEVVMCNASGLWDDTEFVCLGEVNFNNAANI